MDEIPLTISISVLDEQFKQSLNKDKEDIRDLTRDVEDLGKRIDSEMNKAGVTMSSFSKSSRDIGTVLSDSFDGAKEALERNNASLSKLENLTARIKSREAELIEIRANNFAEVKALREEAQKLSTTTIPILEEKGDTAALDAAKEKLEEINERIEEINQDSQKAWGESDHLSAFGSKVGELSEAFREQREKLLEVSNAFSETEEKYDESIDKHSTFASQLRMVQAEMEEMIRLAQESGDASAVEATKSSKEYKDLAEKAKSLKDSIASIKGKDAADSLSPLIRSISQVSSAFRNTKNPISAFRAGLTGARGVMGLTKISIKGVITSLRALWAAMWSNPITAIIALIAALVAALIALFRHIKSQAEKQAELNEQEKAHLELLKQKTEASDRMYDSAIKDKERELSVLKAGNSSLKEQYKIEDEIYKLKKKKADEALEEWAEEAASVDELNEQLKKQQAALQALTEVQNGRKRRKVNKDADYTDEGIHVNRRSVEIDGVKITRGSVDDMVTALQGMVDNTKTKLEMGIQVKEDAADVEAEGKRIAEQRKKDAKNVAATERAITKETADLRISLMSDSYAREVAAAKQASKDKIADLKRRLQEEKDLSIEAQNQINEQIKLQEKKLQRDLVRLAQEQALRKVAIQRQIEDAQKTSAPRTADEQRADLATTYTRKKEDISNQIRSGVATGSLSAAEIKLLKELRDQYEKKYVAELELLNQQLALDALKVEKDALSLRLSSVEEGSAQEYELRRKSIEKEREEALAANRQLAKDRQQSEADINAKFDKQQKHLLEGQLSAYLTYENRKQKIAEEFNRKREALYKHDENGNRVKDENGNDVFIDGAGSGNLEELKRQEDEALVALGNEIASRSDVFSKWLGGLSEKTVKQLRVMLEASKKALENLQKDPDADPKKLEEAEIKVKQLEAAIEQAGLTPEEEDFEEWKRYCDVITKAGEDLTEFGDAMEGVFGESVSAIGKVISATSDGIKNIKDLVVATSKGIAESSDAAAKAALAAQSSVAILAIIAAIYTAITKLRDAVDGWGEDWQWLSDYLHNMTDNLTIQSLLTAGLSTLWDNTAKKAREHDKALEDIDNEIDELSTGYDALGKQAQKTFGASNAEIRRQQIELKKAQIELLKTAIAEEEEQKDPDNDKIKGWQNQISTLEGEIDDLAEAAVDAIWGEDINSAINSFADALADAWSSNTDAAQASNDAIREMIRKRIKQELLDEIKKEGKLKAIREAISNAFSDGIITEEELAAIEALGEQTAQELEEKYGSVFRMLNEETSNDRSAQARGIATASQESVDELNGRMTDVQGHTFHLSENSDIMRDTIIAIFGSVQRIENNTEELHTIRVAINDIQTQGVRIRS